MDAYIGQSVRPVAAKLADKNEQKKQAYADAESLNANMAPLLPEGLLKKSAMNAKGERAVKVNDRVIAQLDLAQPDQAAVEALSQWRQSEVGMKAKPETLAKVDAAIAAGGDLAKSTFGQIPIAVPAAKEAKPPKPVDINSPPIVKVTDAIRDASDALSTVDSAVMAAGSVGKDGRIEVDPSLFGPLSGKLAVAAANYHLTGVVPFLGFSAAQLEAKNRLVGYASNSLSAYQRSVSGLTVGEQESQRIQQYWVTGFEPSAKQFTDKVAVIRDLVGQQQYWRDLEYKARIANDPVALENAVLRQRAAVANAGAKLEGLSKEALTQEERDAYNALPPEDQ